MIHTDGKQTIANAPGLAADDLLSGPWLAAAEVLSGHASLKDDMLNRIDDLETLLREASEVIGLLRIYEGTSVAERAHRLQERIDMTVAS